jgi:ADP-ribose pyrophosphatase
MTGPWRTLATRQVYRNRWLGLREDRILRPRSGEGIYSVVERLDSLTVVPRDADGGIYLVRQYRYPVGRYSWEIPAGTLEPGEEPIAAARRELREETGVTADRWTHLGDFWDAPGFCNQISHAYLAEGLTLGEPEAEAIEEDLLVRRFELPEIEAMILRGELLDGLTITALHLMKLRGL